MNNLFTDDQSDVELDPTKDYLSELVGEGKKYADEKALAFSRVKADEHIQKLEAEQARLRQELETRLNMEKFLDQLNSAKSQLSNPEPQASGEPPMDTSALKPEEIANLVAQQVNQLELQKSAQRNVQEAMAKLREAYGPNFANKLRQEAAELGMSEQEMNNLAARNPKALYKLLGIGEQRQVDNFTTPPKTSLTLPPSGKKKGYSHFEEIRKNSLTEYFSPKVQNEMFALAKEMGDEFYKH